MITMFWPGRLWRGGRPERVADAGGKTKIVNWKSEPIGTWVSGEDWPGLCRWIMNAGRALAKEDLGAFICAKMRGPRCVENVEFVTAIGLDGDKTHRSAADIHALLAGYRHIVYSTFSSTPAEPRWRAIIALSRWATAEEHYHYIPGVHANLSAVGVNVDPAAIDPCRLWYLPCYRVRENFECFVGEGAPFDVDRALVTSREAAEERQQQAEQRAKSYTARGGDRVARARAYIAKMPPAVSGEGGHLATWNVARKLLQDFGLSPDQAWAVLLEYNARCKPPWSDRELHHKLVQATTNARISNPVDDRGRA